MRFNNKNVILPEPIPETRFRLVSLQNGSTVKLSAKASAYSILEYSLDGHTWNSLTTSSTFTLNNNDIMFIRGKLTANAYWSGNYNGFYITGQVAVKGNIMYLYDYEQPNNKTLVYKFPFFGLFRGCPGIVDASELILPATTLSNNCYVEMFKNCTNLQKSPVEFPALVLSNNCYQEMFNGCNKLTTTPILPAPVLVQQCYQLMFMDCYLVNKVITYALTGLNSYVCLLNWLHNTAATGDFYNLGGANYPSGESGIPSGWTVHTSL